MKFAFAAESGHTYSLARSVRMEDAIVDRLDVADIGFARYTHTQQNANKGIYTSMCQWLKP